MILHDSESHCQLSLSVTFLLLNGLIILNYTLPPWEYTNSEYNIFYLIIHTSSTCLPPPPPHRSTNEQTKFSHISVSPIKGK